MLLFVINAEVFNCYYSYLIDTLMNFKRLLIIKRYLTKICLIITKAGHKFENQIVICT